MQSLKMFSWATFSYDVLPVISMEAQWKLQKMRILTNSESSLFSIKKGINLVQQVKV